MRLLITLLVFAACAREPAIDRQKVKLERIATLQRDLLTAMEAEKSAVLARTDAEAARFTEAWKHDNAAVETGRAELRGLIEVDARPSEREALTRFDEAWAQLAQVDAELLQLTAANSNAQASRLVTSEAKAALDELVDALEAGARASKDGAEARRLLEAAIAALRVHVALPTHVSSGDDGEMTQLEARLATDEALVDTALASRPPPRAQEAWGRYRETVSRIVELSRQNTHVKASALSLSRKREAMLAALKALSALEAAVRDVPRATR